jgi:predicted enzyme related to lactoylglutathione lyase
LQDPSPISGKFAFFDCDGTRLYLAEGPGEASIIYFSVSDILAAHAGMQQRGIEILAAPHLVHRHDDGVEEWMAFFNDNEGRPLALMAQAGRKMEE